MVDAKLFMAAERNGYNGQIFEALKNRFPEISEHVISQTLQSVVSFVKLFPVPVSGSLFGLFGQCGHFIERSEKVELLWWNHVLLFPLRTTTLLGLC